MAGQHRIVVFTGDLSNSVRRSIVEIDHSIDSISWLVIVHAPRKSLGVLLRNQWRNWRRNGWRWVPYQADDLWQRVRARQERGNSTAAGDPWSLEQCTRL